MTLPWHVGWIIMMKYYYSQKKSKKSKLKKHLFSKCIHRRHTEKVLYWKILSNTSTTRHLSAHHDNGSKKSFRIYVLQIWNTFAFKVEKQCRVQDANMLVNRFISMLFYDSFYYNMSLKWTVSQELWIVFSHNYSTISIYIISHAFSNLITI